MLILLFGLFLNLSAGASMVSFYVIETGLPESRLNNEHSVQWENAFMDVFFDAGHIVSNAPMMRFEIKPQGDVMQFAGISIPDARNWGIDFILITQLDYSDAAQSPANINFIIYRVNANEKIFERQLSGRSYRSSREEYDDIKLIIRSLIQYISG